MSTAGAVLNAPYVLEYTYRRSVGPVLGRFLAGLRDGTVLGARTASGRVLVPPQEYDPETSEPVSDLVEVASRGSVVSWTWVDTPREKHPLVRPFAWALVKLDGADTPLLHAVDAGSPEAMRTGMRVQARWRPERTGSIADLACFEPEGLSAGARAGADAAGARATGDPVRRVQSPVRLEYIVSGGPTLSRFLAGLVEGRLLGRRCSGCAKVYVPPRGACPTCALPMNVDERNEIPLADAGTVTTFCIVNVPFEGQTMKLPYVYASILLDGADIPMLHLVNAPAAEARMGMRVRAEWVPPGERRPTLESIRWFVPSGEPDAPFASYQEHL